MARSIFIVLLFLSLAVYGQRHTISGYIEDAETGERLPGAAIIDIRSGRGAVSNDYGFYNIIINQNDTVLLQYSFTGYLPDTIYKVIRSNMEQSVQLTSSTVLDEIVISGKKEYVKLPELGIIQISMGEIKKLPSLTGEADVIKAFQFMPGVSFGNEGSAGLFVRGGSPDQNIITLDGIPIYNVNHLGGMVTVFDENTIKSAKLYKGGFPAQYGGRLSGVLDIKTIEGNNDKIKGEIRLGTMTSKLFLEGPLIKGKTTFLFSARNSNMGPISRPLSRYSMDGKGYVTFNFYDLMAKVSHEFSNKDQVDFNIYTGSDGFKMKYLSDGVDVFSGAGNNGNDLYDGLVGFKWGNLQSGLRWNHSFSPRLFSNLSLGISRYSSYNIKNMSWLAGSEKNLVYNTQTNHSMGIQDLIARYDLDYFISNNQSIKAGVNVNYQSFLPGIYQSHTAIDSSFIKTKTFGTLNELNINLEEKEINALIVSGYAEDEIFLTDNLSANLGIRYDIHRTEGGTNYSLQPRAIINIGLTDKSAIKASYTKMQQYVNLLVSSGAGLPNDLWVPVTAQTGELFAHQYSVSFVQQLRSSYTISVDGFYKEMKGLVEYKEGESRFSSITGWADKIVTGGEGIAKGLELLAEKKYGNLTGWISYTLSSNTRKFELLNSGNPYPFKYHRKHDLSVLVNYKINEQVSFSSSWIYTSGIFTTLGVSKFPVGTFTPNNAIIREITHQIATNYNYAYYYPSKNNYKMPDYHRLDISFQFTKKKKRGVRTWKTGVYNVYNRLNPYGMYYQYDHLYDKKFKLYKIVLFPIIPTVSYSFAF